MTPEESGTDTECEQLWVRALKRALVADSPSPVLLLLAGEAGTGKTREVRRLLAASELRAAPRLLLRCTGTGLRPFAPVRPGRAGRTEPPPAEVPGADELVAAVHRGGGPRLLVVEDVHRADPPLLAALRELLAEPPAALATLLSYRPEELAVPGLALGEAVDYPAELAVLRQRTVPLTEAQVRRMAVAKLGEERVSPEFTARLLRRSGGVAQVVVDLLRGPSVEARRPRGSLDPDAAGVPVRLAELVLGRTARLDEEAQRMVWAAAVLEEPASLRLLTAVAGLSPQDGGPALVRALRGAALGRRAADSYGFTVPLAARAVYAELPGPVRQELHGRAARELARSQPVPWFRLAAHRRDSGQPGSWAKALERAAADGAERGEHLAVVRLLEEAMAHPGLPEPTRVRLAPMLARSAVVGMRSDQTVRVLRQIVDDPGLPLEVRGKVRLDLSLLLANQLGEGYQGRKEMERAVEELRDQPAVTARVMSSLGIPYVPTAPLSQCMAWLRRAEEAAEASGDELVRLAVTANVVSVLVGVGDPEGWRLLEEFPRDVTDPARAQHIARGLCNSADGAVLLGYYDRAATLLEEGLYHAVRSGAFYQEQTGRGTGLLLEWTTGRWAGLTGRCEAFVEEVGEMPLIVEEPRVVLALLALARGDWAQVGQWLSGDGFPEPESASVPLAAATSTARIRLALAREDVAGAAAEAEAAWARMRKSEVWVWAAELAPWAVEASAKGQSAKVAQEMTAEFAAGLEGRDAPAARIALEWCRALVSEAAGETDAAAAMFRQASAAFAKLGRPYPQALTMEAAFRCALAGGEEPDSAELVAAVDQLAELGAVWDASRARAMLRAHRPAAPEEKRSPGRPGYGDQLSPREREVADLAAAGLTNREIATTLHLSPRTVEQHVARAMRKLGTQSRQDLAASRQEAVPE